MKWGWISGFRVEGLGMLGLRGEETKRRGGRGEEEEGDRKRRGKVFVSGFRVYGSGVWGLELTFV